MLAALGNGVKGGKWHSLMDKVYAPATLERAWRNVRVKKGAGGVDAMSISKFDAQQTTYLQELHNALKQQRYHVQAVKRIGAQHKIIRFDYFKHAGCRLFSALDGFVRRRLRSILRKYQKKIGGSGRNQTDHRAWPNTYFAKLGLFTMHTNYVKTSESRC